MAKLYAGLDISKDKTSVCVVTERGEPIFEGEALSNARSISALLQPYRRGLAKVRHETGMFTPWLHKELLRKRLPAVCLDARHTRAALAAQRNKTDRNDARDIAIIMSRGFNRSAYVKSDDAHEIRMLLACRRALRRKARDLEAVLRTTLKSFGANLDQSGGKLVVKFPPRRRKEALVELCDQVIEARTALLENAKKLDEKVQKLAKSDMVCRRLMTAPGVGPITALTFKAAVDDPYRFTSSRAVAAHFGLTPRRIQSGQKDFSGHISRMGDGSVRTALYEAGAAILVSCKKMTRLRAWGLAIRQRKGFKHACIACARKLAVILHRMWVSERDFTDQATTL